MPKQYLNPDTLFPSLKYGFSQVVTSAPGKLVFMSGQVAWDAKQQIVGPGDLKAQTWQALSNVERAVQAAGGSLEDVVSMRIYIVKEQLTGSAAIREGLQAFFPKERPPATTWIGVESLANEAFLVEIEAIAVIES